MPGNKDIQAVLLAKSLVPSWPTSEMKVHCLCHITNSVDDIIVRTLQIIEVLRLTAKFDFHQKLKLTVKLREINVKLKSCNAS
jgi:hypothetical protein